MGDKQEYKEIKRLEMNVGMWRTGGDKCGIEEWRVGPFHGSNTTLLKENKSIYNPPHPHGGNGGE